MDGLEGFPGHRIRRLAEVELEGDRWRAALAAALQEFRGEVEVVRDGLAFDKAGLELGDEPWNCALKTPRQDLGDELGAQFLRLMGRNPSTVVTSGFLGRRTMGAWLMRLRSPSPWWKTCRNAITTSSRRGLNVW